MSDSAFFKVKSSKRSNPEARTTLDAIHNQKVQTMLEEKDNIAKYKEEQTRISSLEWLKKKLKNPFQKRRIWQIQAEIVEMPTVFTNPM